jgi:aerobic-type carbon monoxide dehydrogenase small subunit (CoxS/CutS family)
VGMFYTATWWECFIDKHKNVSSFCFTLQTLIVSDLLENIEKNILQKQLANLNRNFAGMICGK